MRCPLCRSILVGFLLISGCGSEPETQAEGTAPPVVQQSDRVLPADLSMDGYIEVLSTLISGTPELAHESIPLTIQDEDWEWEMGMVSWISSDASGLIYMLHRGDNAPNVVVLAPDGMKVGSWGQGLYVTPHSLRIDQDGNVWTTDSGNSKVLKFSPSGDLLMEIDVGGMPEGCTSAFCGITDIAFGPDGRLFVSDGYRNARILEFDSEGRLVGEWGSPGVGAGQFNLPHSILVHEHRLYVADRENGRVQWFELDGRFLGETMAGKVFSLADGNDAIWASSQHLHEPNMSPGWLLKLDPLTGTLLGRVPSTGGHGIHLNHEGQALIAPGPNFEPHRFMLMEP